MSALIAIEPQSATQSLEEPAVSPSPRIVPLLRMMDVLSCMTKDEAEDILVMVPDHVIERYRNQNLAHERSLEDSHARRAQAQQVAAENERQKQVRADACRDQMWTEAPTYAAAMAEATTSGSQSPAPMVDIHVYVVEQMGCFDSVGSTPDEAKEAFFKEVWAYTINHPDPDDLDRDLWADLLEDTRNAARNGIHVLLRVPANELGLKCVLQYSSCTTIEPAVRELLGLPAAEAVAA